MATRQFSFVPNLFTVTGGSYALTFNHGAGSALVTDLASIQPSSATVTVGNPASVSYNAWNEANVQDRPHETDFQLAATIFAADVTTATFPATSEELRIRVLPQTGTTALQFGLKKFINQSGIQPQFLQVQLQSPDGNATPHSLIFADALPLAELLVDGTIALLVRVPSTGVIRAMLWSDIVAALTGGALPVAGTFTLQITVQGTYLQA